MTENCARKSCCYPHLLIASVYCLIMYKWRFVDIYIIIRYDQIVYIFTNIFFMTAVAVGNVFYTKLGYSSYLLCIMLGSRYSEKIFLLFLHEKYVGTH